MNLTIRLSRTLALILTIFLTGCGEDKTDGAVKQNIETELAEVMRAAPSPIQPEQVAEAFALGSNFTDLQRDILRKELIGNVVEWTIPIYEVEMDEGSYKISSQPIPIKSREAYELLRVVCFVYPKNDAEIERLQLVKTNDKIKIRGKVRDIVVRTAVVVEPALLAD